VSLVARAIEEAGIPTVIIGSGKDIVEHCGVPRLVFTDFPLGNPAGPPYDRTSQAAIAAQAIDLLETATEPRTTVNSPVLWPEGEGWRHVYNYIGPENRDALRAEGEERRARQQRDRQGLAAAEAD